MLSQIPSRDCLTHSTTLLIVVRKMHTRFCPCAHLFSQHLSQLKKDMPALAVASLSTPMQGDGKQLTKESKGGRGSAILSELNAESGGTAGTERGSKKKKGKSAGNTKSSTIEIAQDNEEVIPTKS